MLSVAMVVTQMPVVSMAEIIMPVDGSIASFEALEDSVAKQSVAVGTGYEELNLPDTVAAAVYHVTENAGEGVYDGDIKNDDDIDSIATPSEADANDSGKDNGKPEVTVTTSMEKISVTWDSEPSYDGERAGRYVFTAEADGYVLSERAIPPQITVTVYGAALRTINDRFTVDGLNYKETGAAAVQVLGIEDPNVINDGKLTIPKQVIKQENGRTYQVTSIGYGAFENNKNIKNVEIPDQVESIGGHAFSYCVGLEGELIIPGNVVIIGPCAFQGCEKLTKLTIPGSVKTIGSSAYQFCDGLTEVVLMEGLESIEERAFAYCTSWGGTVTIPSDVSIGKGAEVTVKERSSIMIGSDAGLTVEEDAVLTINGTVTNGGILTNYGTITVNSGGTLALGNDAVFNNYGTLDGEGTMPDDKVYNKNKSKVNLAVSNSNPSYGDTITLTAAITEDAAKPAGVLSRALTKPKHVFFYRDGVELGNAEVTGTDEKKAVLEVSVVSEGSEGGLDWKIGTEYMLKAKYTGGNDQLLPAESEEILLTVKKASQGAPEIAIDYEKKELTGFDSNGQYNISGSNVDNSTLSPINGSVKIDLGWYGKELKIVKAGDDYHNDSEPQTLAVPERPEAPATPKVTSRTDTTVTVDAVDGQEYRLSEDSFGWQATGKFDNLEAGKTYIITTRVKAVAGQSFASDVSEGTTVTTKSKSAEAPAVEKPVVTSDSVTLQKNENWEYSVDGNNWNDNCEFTDLQAATKYTYYVRIKETDTAMPSESATVIVYTAAAMPAEGVGYSIDYKQEIIVITEGYEVSIMPDFASVITGGSLIEPDRDYFVRKAAETKTDGTIPASVPNTFKTSARPEAPTLTYDSVNEQVEIPTGYYYNTASAEYDRGDWKQGEGTGVIVEPGNVIYIYQAATDSAFKSAVQTLKAVDRGEAPAIAINYEAETLNTLGTMEYRYDDSTSVSGWTECGENMSIPADWLSTGKTVYIRTKATNGSPASKNTKIIIPARPAAPAIPMAVRKTANAITIANAGEFSGCQFSINGTDWDENGVFSGLTAGGTYMLYVRYKATEAAFSSGSAQQSVVTVNENGSSVIKPGESTVIGDSTVTNDGKTIIVESVDTITTITPPNSGDVVLDIGGAVVVPGGSTVQTGENPKVVLPDGGTVDKDGVISGDKIQIGDTIINGSGTTVPPDGSVTVPSGGTVQKGENPEVVLPDGGTVDKDGVIVLPENGTIQVGSNPTTTITFPDGGKVTVNENGQIILPGGATVQTGGGEPVTVPDVGGVIDPVDGTVTPNAHTVTFNSGEGSEVPSVSVPHGGLLTKPADPARSGFRFDGWYKEEQFENLWNFETDTVTSSITLYAKWTYRSGGDSSSDNDSSASGSSAGTMRKGSYTAADDRISQSISRSGVQQLVDSGKSLTLNSEAAGMTLAPEALKAVLAAVPATANDIAFTVEPVDLAAFPDAATLIGSRPAYDFSINYKDNTGGTVNVKIEFPAGSASISIKCTPVPAEITGNLFMVYVDGSGAVTWLGKSSYNSGKMLAEVSHFSIYGVAYKAPAAAFADTIDHWAKADIEFAAARELFPDAGTGQFAPDAAMTKAMFVTALGRLAGVNPDSYRTHSFTDVAPDANYAPYAGWAVQKKIVSGAGENLFSPDTPVTREQMAVMMVNYAGQMGYSIPTPLAGAPFADSDTISEGAVKEVSAMQRAGILKSKNGNCFDPQGNATRAEASAALRRFVEIVIEPATAQGWKRNDSGEWLYYQNGKPAIGWKEIGGRWYYFDPNGAMLANTVIDGFEVGADGARKE